MPFGRYDIEFNNSIYLTSNVNIKNYDKNFHFYVYS